MKVTKRKYMVVGCCITVVCILSGCISGPVRSALFGHKESPMINWTSNSPSVAKPFTAVGGALVEVPLVVSDTTIKTVNNVLVRPFVDIHEKVADVSNMNPIGYTLGMTLMSVMYPFAVIADGIDHDAWDTCWGNATEDRIENLIKEGKYSEAHNLALIGFGFVKEKEGFAEEEVEPEEGWRRSWIKKVEASRQLDLDNHQWDLSRKTRSLIYDKKFKEAEAACNDFMRTTVVDGGFAEIGSIGYKELGVVRVAWAQHLEAQLKEACEKKMSIGDYTGAQELCKSFSTTTIANLQHRLEEIQKERLDFVRDQWAKHLADDLKIYIEVKMRAFDFAGAQKVCKAFSTTAIEGRQIELKKVQEEHLNAVRDAWVKYLGEELKKMCETKIASQDFNGAQAICKAFSTTAVDGRQDDLMKLKDAQLELLYNEWTQSLITSLKKDCVRKMEQKDFAGAEKACLEFSLKGNHPCYEKLNDIRDQCLGNVRCEWVNELKRGLSAVFESKIIAKDYAGALQALDSYDISELSDSSFRMQIDRYKEELKTELVKNLTAPCRIAADDFVKMNWVSKAVAVWKELDINAVKGLESSLTTIRDNSIAELQNKGPLGYVSRSSLLDKVDSESSAKVLTDIALNHPDRFVRYLALRKLNPEMALIYARGQVVRYVSALKGNADAKNESSFEMVLAKVLKENKLHLSKELTNKLKATFFSACVSFLEYQNANSEHLSVGGFSLGMPFEDAFFLCAADDVAKITLVMDGAYEFYTTSGFKVVANSLDTVIRIVIPFKEFQRIINNSKKLLKSSDDVIRTIVDVENWMGCRYGFRNVEEIRWIRGYYLEEQDKRNTIQEAYRIYFQNGERMICYSGMPHSRSDGWWKCGEANFSYPKIIFPPTVWENENWVEGGSKGTVILHIANNKDEYP